MDEEERNYCAIALLLSRVGLVHLRQYFINKWNSAGGFLPWTDCPQNGADLLTKFNPLDYEKDKVKTGNTLTWDLSLFVKALQNSKPAFVPKKDKIMFSGLKCLKETRNTLCHTESGRIKTADYKKLYCNACNALMKVGATSQDFKKVRKDVQQPWSELLSLVNKCITQDKDILLGVNSINKRLDQLQKGQEELKQGQQQSKQRQDMLLQGQSGLEQGQKKMLKEHSDLQQGQEKLQQGQSSLQQGQEQIIEGMQNLHLPSTSSKKSPSLSSEDVQSFSSKLKCSTRAQTEFQPKLMASHSVASVRTNEIFTNLMIQRGRKPLPKGGTASRGIHLAEYNRPSGSPIKKCEDIFINPKKDKPNPKTILVTGKPGIGKSLFCQRLARDWADDVLFNSDASTSKTTDDFDFVYLMTFRQMNLFGDEKLTFCDVLNLCSLADDRALVNDPLFDHIVEHPEKILFILDGYDEYSNRIEISQGHFEQKYENNPRLDMPVPVLISKLLRKKILGGAVVMVTSRPNEADELGGIKIDADVEICGFSVEQVKEFIGKYYLSKPESMKTAALEHIMNNENLLSIAHVPMLCYLVCWCVEWHIESKTDKTLPVTITQLYSEVVEIFELKHHSKSKYRATEVPHDQDQLNDPVIKATVDKLSELAAATFKDKELIFDESVIDNFHLTCEEIGNLKASGVITSGPSFRISALKMSRDFCFSHFTLHEYFAARGFVNDGILPPTLAIENGEMVFVFIAGRLSKAEHGERLMERLLDELISANRPDWLLIAKCLYEYGDKAFGVRMLEKYYRDDIFSSEDDGFLFGKYISTYDNVECVVLSFILDLISCYEQREDCRYRPLGIHGLSCDIKTVQGLKRVVESLQNQYCPINRLIFRSDVVECCECLFAGLPSTKIDYLTLKGMSIDDEIVAPLSRALPKTRINRLKLDSDSFIPEGFSDEGLFTLCEALPSTEITRLALPGDGFTDEGIYHLGETLPSTNIFELCLHGSSFPDEWLEFLSEFSPSTDVLRWH